MLLEYFRATFFNVNIFRNCLVYDSQDHKRPFETKTNHQEQISTLRRFCVFSNDSVRSEWNIREILFQRKFINLNGYSLGKIDTHNINV